MNELVIFWLAVVIIAFIIDILTSNFCFMLFSIGAFVAAILAIFGISFMFQVIIFSILSIIFLAGGYPLLKKKFKVSQMKTPLMEEKYIGKIIKSDKDIIEKGQVKVNGEYWTVINEGDNIGKGEKFIITGIEGIKLKVKKIQEE